MVKFNAFRIISWVGLGFLALTCAEEKLRSREYPVINTKDVTDISPSGATFNADILDVGSSGISDYGFIYSDTQDPLPETSEKISLGKATKAGTFSALANSNLAKDKKYYVKSYATSTAGKTTYGIVVNFISQGGAPPVITEVSPLSGSIGDTIRVVGKSFSRVAANNLISLGGILLGTLKIRPDTMWCIVHGSTPVGDNVVTIKVGQVTATASQKFNIKQITFSGFTPGFVWAADTISITGLNFPKGKNLVSVSMLGKTAIVTSATATKIKALVAAGVTQTSSLISLVAGTQTAISATPITLLKPVINNFTPVKGTLNTEITINGDYFLPTLTGNQVTINGKNLAVTSATKNVLKAKVPSGISPASYPIVVTTLGQVTNSLGSFEIVKPVISLFAPITATWGDIVTITGENFGPATADNIVKFGTTVATIVSASPTELKVTVPSQITNRFSIITVQAITTDNQFATAPGNFALAAPEITTFTPVQGKGNILVTIDGNNFNPDPNKMTVTFGSVSGSISTSSKTQITVVAPTSAPDGDVIIQVTSAEQTTGSLQTFHFISPWKRLNDFGGTERMQAASFAVGNYGFVTLGREGAQFPTRPTWKYDPTTDQWTQATNFNFDSYGAGGAYYNQVAFSTGASAYVGTGIAGSSGPLARMVSYTAASDSYQGIAPLPSAIDAAVGYSPINGKGYVATGRNSSNTAVKTLWEYTPGTDSWVAKPNLSGAARLQVSGFSVNEKLYVIGGASCFGCVTYFMDNWEYDVFAETWRSRAGLPGTSRNGMTGFSVGGWGYMVGGETSTGGKVNAFWRYNPSVNAWFELPNFPGTARSNAIAFTINGKVYYGTGSGPVGYLKDMWEFDPSKL